MIARVFNRMAFFSTAKYELFNGKFLLPPPPKRPLSAYILFGQDVRKNKPATTIKHGNKANVVEQMKKIGSSWKLLTPEEKAKYDEESKKLRQKYEIERAQYDAKYRQPFKTITANQLLMKEFYQKNKFTNFQEGSKSFSLFKNQLKQEDKQKYVKKAEEINKSNEKITSMYSIPQLQFKDLNSYIRHLRKKNESIPQKKQIKETQLAKFNKEYQQIRKKYTEDLKIFAKSFSMGSDDLIKIINQNKKPEEKLNDQGRMLKELQKEQTEQVKQKLEKTKEKLEAKKAQLKIKTQKLVAKQLRQLQKEFEKEKKALTRANTKFRAKRGKIERQKVQLQIQTSALKNIEKKKNSKNSPEKKVESQSARSETKQN